VPIPDAVAQPLPGPSPVHTRVRMPPPPAPRVPALGNATRDVVDQRQAAAARSLSEAIRPGMVLRVERTRPTWCMGFVEDYPIEEGETLATFLEHMRDEHGGQSYRVHVLGGGDVVLFEGKLVIAGQPKQHGRPINRAKWEGWEEQQQSGANSSRSELGGLTEFLTLFMSQQQKTSDAQLRSVELMVEGTRKQTTELMNSVVAARGDERARQSFTEQLGQFVEATRGIEKVKKQLFGAAAQQQQGGGDDDDVTLEKEAKRFFMQSVLGSMTPKKNGAAPRQQPRQTRVSIPDSQPGGQTAPKN